jgi:hypothetical protein
MQGEGLPTTPQNGPIVTQNIYRSAHAPTLTSYLGAPQLGAAGLLAALGVADPNVMSLLETQRLREKAVMIAMEKKRMLDEARLLNEIELQRALGERMQTSQSLGLQPTTSMMLRVLEDQIPLARALSPDTDGTNSESTSEGEQKDAVRFRVQDNNITDLRMRQDDTWETRFNELAKFKMMNAHCNVPRRYKLNPKLGVWVCSLRQQMTRGTLNKAKIERLNQIGFQWRITVIKGAQINPQITKADTWNERLNLLISFKTAHGHFKVPSVHRKLSKWVQAQRRQRKLGKLSKDREDKLNNVGFDWKHNRQTILGGKESEAAP